MFLFLSTPSSEETSTPKKLPSSNGSEETGQKERRGHVHEHDQRSSKHDDDEAKQVDESKNASAEAKGEAAADDVDAKQCDNAHSRSPTNSCSKQARAATEHPTGGSSECVFEGSVLTDQMDSVASASESLVHMSRDDLRQWLDNSPAMEHMYAICPQHASSV